MDREKIKDARSFFETPAFEGAQVAYSWNQLEQGKDGYDFSMIREDLAFLTSKNKKLWVQIQDVSFSERYTIPEVIDFAKEYLRADYIFWSTEEPYFSNELVPLMRKLQR